jgi:hypothetical protein
MADTALVLRDGTIIQAQILEDFAAINTSIDTAVSQGLYEINGVLLTERQRETYIALGYDVRYHNNAYTISWVKPV